MLPVTGPQTGFQKQVKKKKPSSYRSEFCNRITEQGVIFFPQNRVLNHENAKEEMYSKGKNTEHLKDLIFRHQEKASYLRKASYIYSVKIRSILKS